MNNSLHQFDLTLCGYVVGNVRHYLEGYEMPSEKLVLPRIDNPRRQSFTTPTFPMWMASQFSPLVEYVWPMPFDPNAPLAVKPAMMLSLSELHELHSILSEYPRHETLHWKSNPTLHWRCRLCVPEMQKRLTRQIAEDWSNSSGEYGTKLSQDNLLLDEGVEIVIDWIRLLRELQRLIGTTQTLPYSDHGGQQPTPTHPDSIEIVSGEVIDLQLAKHVDVIRDAIKVLTPKAKPDAIIRKVRINRQIARRVLRYLETKGEYEGFSRPHLIKKP